MLRLIFNICICVLLVSCHTSTQQSAEISKLFEWDLAAENHTGKSQDQFANDGKFRGMTAFNWRKDNYESANQLVKNNIEWVALVPFMFQKTDTTKMVRPLRTAVGEWAHYDSSYMEVVHELHGRNMHVMMKPHLWMHEGWRAELDPGGDGQWEAWFDSYRPHMLHYALLAESLGVELYCIGTELRSAVKHNPSRWLQLISDIKSVYSGKLTYAANWDGEFDDVPFWDEMDYIGVQSYFPLTDKKKPSLADIEKGWHLVIPTLQRLSEQHNKQILFTETGYRSDQSATIRPWEWHSEQDSTAIVCNQTQLLAYEALFRQLWDKEWFAGVFFWQWHNRHSTEYTVGNKDFTPRYKPAENALARWYGK